MSELDRKEKLKNIVSEALDGTQIINEKLANIVIDDICLLIPQIYDIINDNTMSIKVKLENAISIRNKLSNHVKTLENLNHLNSYSDIIFETNKIIKYMDDEFKIIFSSMETRRSFYVINDGKPFKLFIPDEYLSVTFAKYLLFLDIIDLNPKMINGNNSVFLDIFNIDSSNFKINKTEITEKVNRTRYTDIFTTLKNSYVQIDEAEIANIAPNIVKSRAGFSYIWSFAKINNCIDELLSCISEDLSEIDQFEKIIFIFLEPRGFKVQELEKLTTIPQIYDFIEDKVNEILSHTNEADVFFKELFEHCFEVCPNLTQDIVKILCLYKGNVLNPSESIVSKLNGSFRCEEYIEKIEENRRKTENERL